MCARYPRCNVVQFVRGMCVIPAHQKMERGGEATRQGGRILDINQTGLQLKKGGIEETSETASNMEFCLSIAQIGPLIPLVRQSMRQMALDWLILIERQLLSSCLLPSVGSSFLALGRSITEEQSATCFSLRFKDVLAALLHPRQPSTHTPTAHLPHLFLSECGADRGPFILFKVVRGILYQRVAQDGKAL